MNVKDACKLIGLSQWTIREAARNSEIAGTREGRDWDLVESSVRGFKKLRRLRGANRSMLELMKRGIVS